MDGGSKRGVALGSGFCDLNFSCFRLKPSDSSLSVTCADSQTPGAGLNSTSSSLELDRCKLELIWFKLEFVRSRLEFVGFKLELVVRKSAGIVCK